MASADPFWGPMDAAHQFCEAKYAVSPVVAEFWNCISNVPCFIIPGLYSLCRGWSRTDLRVKALWMGMILVGIGSMTFHGTMRFKWEMLDEIPMVLLVASGLVSKDDTHWASSGRWKYIWHAVCGICALVGMTLYIKTGVYEVFIQTFTAVILLDLVLCIPCCWRPDAYGSNVTKGLLIAYVCVMVSGKFFWELEVRFCAPGTGGPLAWLHVLWHVLSGLGCYFGILADAHNRFSAFGVGVAADDPSDRWPLVWIFGSWLRPASARSGKAD